MSELSELLPPTAAVDPAAEVLRQEVRAFITEQLESGGFTPQLDSWLTGWDPEFSAKLGSMGWVGMTIPTRYGGHGRTATERYVVIEELLAAGAPLAAHWFADRQIAPSLLSYGTEEHREKYLPRIAEGTFYFAIGLSEPDAGSDLAAVRTRATQVDGGWVINGTKVWTSGGHESDSIIVLARSSPRDDNARHAGLSQFICDLPAQGVSINPIRLMSGAHHFNEVVFEDVFIPDEQVLGTIGEGWKQVTSELAYERSGPERFLSSLPLLQAMTRRAALPDAPDTLVAAVGQLTGRLWTLRQLSLAIAGALERGETPDVPAALVKDLGTIYEQDIVDQALQLVGGSADLTSTDEIDRLLADGVMQAPGFTLRGGTNEILRGVVARSLGLR